MNPLHLAPAATLAKAARLTCVGLAALALCACSVLSPTATPPPAFYALNGVQGAQGAPRTSSGSTTAVATRVTGQGTRQGINQATYQGSNQDINQTTPASATLIINPPRAAPGFDSQRIIYLREAHKLEYFANSEWVDPPARMLGTLLLASLQSSAAFRAVVLAPGTAVGEIRLETEIIRLQQDFQTRPSRAQFTLRATLLDDKTRRVLAWREFDASVPAPTDDPYGGVLAANLAVQAVLKEMVGFCEEQVRKP